MRVFYENSYRIKYKAISKRYQVRRRRLYY